MEKTKVSASAKNQKSELFKCEICSRMVHPSVIKVHQTCHASQIFDWLYLGSSVNSRNEKELFDGFKIDANINTAVELENKFEHRAEYFSLKLQDEPDEVIG